MAGRYEKFIQDHYGIQNLTGDEASVYCFNPAHNNVNTPAMTINIESGAYYCFSCEYKGYLDQEVESSESALGRLKSRLQTLAAPVATNTYTVHSEASLLRFNNETDYWTKDRGLLPSTITQFQLGFDPMSNAVTIPNRNVEGELLGVSRRYLDGSADGGKYRHPKGFRKAKNLFAGWMMDGADDSILIVCEGQIDAMKLWQLGYPAVAIYGSRLSDQQLHYIASYSFKKVLVGTDNFNYDLAGKKAIETFKPLRKYLPVYVTDWTRKEPKDFGAMGNSDIHRLIERSKDRLW